MLITLKSIDTSDTSLTECLKEYLNLTFSTQINRNTLGSREIYLPKYIQEKKSLFKEWLEQFYREKDPKKFALLTNSVVQESKNLLFNIAQSEDFDISEDPTDFLSILFVIGEAMRHFCKREDENMESEILIRNSAHHIVNIIGYLSNGIIVAYAYSKMHKEFEEETKESKETKEDPEGEWIKWVEDKTKEYYVMSAIDKNDLLKRIKNKSQYSKKREELDDLEKIKPLLSKIKELKLMDEFLLAQEHILAGYRGQSINIFTDAITDPVPIVKTLWKGGGQFSKYQKNSRALNDQTRRRGLKSAHFIIALFLDTIRGSSDYSFAAMRLYVEIISSIYQIVYRNSKTLSILGEYKTIIENMNDLSKIDRISKSLQRKITIDNKSFLSERIKREIYMYERLYVSIDLTLKRMNIEKAGIAKKHKSIKFYQEELKKIREEYFNVESSLGFEAEIMLEDTEIDLLYFTGTDEEFNTRLDLSIARFADGEVYRRVDVLATKGYVKYVEDDYRRVEKQNRPR